ncbi:hypothetical protein JCM10213v2_000956, partial [Rhodosporidiobolus nylandii]
MSVHSDVDESLWPPDLPRHFSVRYGSRNNTSPSPRESSTSPQHSRSRHGSIAHQDAREGERDEAVPLHEHHPDHLSEYVSALPPSVGGAGTRVGVHASHHPYPLTQGERNERMWAEERAEDERRRQAELERRQAEDGRRPPASASYSVSSVSSLGEAAAPAPAVGQPYRDFSYHHNRSLPAVLHDSHRPHYRTSSLAPPIPPVPQPLQLTQPSRREYNEQLALHGSGVEGWVHRHPHEVGQPWLDDPNPPTASWDRWRSGKPRRWRVGEQDLRREELMRQAQERIPREDRELDDLRRMHGEQYWPEASKYGDAWERMPDHHYHHLQTVPHLPEPEPPAHNPHAPERRGSQETHWTQRIFRSRRGSRPPAPPPHDPPLHSRHAHAQQPPPHPHQQHGQHLQPPDAAQGEEHQLRSRSS